MVLISVVLMLSAFTFPAEKHPGDKSIEVLCGSLAYLARVEPTVLDNWLTRLVIGIEGDKENTGKMADNRLLLQTFATHMVKEVRYVLCMCIYNV